MIYFALMKTTHEKKPDQLLLFPESPVSFCKPLNPLSESLKPLSIANQSRRINHMSKFKPLHEFQKPLIGFGPESFLDYINSVIPGDHLCRLVRQVVFSLDTESIESKYSFLGQNTYHPKLMLSLLFYGYATGVRGSRKLEERCISDHIYIYLMQCYTPDHRTINDFRKNNLEELENYFVEIVRIFNKLGFTKVGKIYIDGTKVKGNASSKRTKKREDFEKWLSNIKEKIADLLKEAEAIDREEEERYKSQEAQELIKQKLSNRNYLKEKIEDALKEMKEENVEKLNLTDRDANYMKSGGSKDIRPGYNCQASVTEDGIIVAADAVTDPNDHDQLEPMIEQTESNTGKKVKEMTADSGYGGYASCEYLEERGIDGYVPDMYFHQYKSGEYQKEENRYHYSNFKYDSSSDSYICPEGKRLKYWKTRKKKTKSRQWNHKVYKGTECTSCFKRSLCTKVKVRELLIDIREPLLKRMREKLLSEEGALKYFKRQYTIEPIFGHLKYNLGYRSFLLRGIEKVRAEFRLMCIGWNLKKMLKMGIKPAAI